jgi:hypothetical protein
MDSRIPSLTRFMSVTVSVALSLSLSSCSSSTSSQSSGQAGSSQVEELGPPESPLGGQALNFEIRPPRGYTLGVGGTVGQFTWKGETYKGKGRFSQIREFRVRIIPSAADTTPSGQLDRELTAMAKDRYQGLRPGKPEIVTIGARGQIPGIEFLRCEYGFDDKVYQKKTANVGTGTGFLYVGVADGCTIMMDSDELDGGNPEKQRIAEAAARTFISLGPRGARAR